MALSLISRSICENTYTLQKKTNPIAQSNNRERATAVHGQWKEFSSKCYFTTNYISEEISQLKYESCNLTHSSDSYVNVKFITYDFRMVPQTKSYKLRVQNIQVWSFALCYHRPILALILNLKCPDYPEILPRLSSAHILITSRRSYELSYSTSSGCKWYNPHTQYVPALGSVKFWIDPLCNCDLTSQLVTITRWEQNTAPTQNIQWPTERYSIKFTYMYAQTKKTKWTENKKKKKTGKTWPSTPTMPSSHANWETERHSLTLLSLWQLRYFGLSHARHWKVQS